MRKSGTSRSILKQINPKEKHLQSIIGRQVLFVLYMISVPIILYQFQFVFILLGQVEYPKSLALARFLFDDIVKFNIKQIAHGRHIEQVLAKLALHNILAVLA